MSLSDFALNAASLMLVQTSFAFVTSPFRAPVYNLPMFLFGFYAIEKTDSNEALRLFTGLLGISALFDVVWLFRHDYNGFIGALIVVNMLIKIPNLMASLASLRQRGDSLGAIGRDRFSGDSSTVWSMPGGFNPGRPGYQNLGDDLEENASAPPPRQVPSRPPPQNPQVTVPGPAPHSHQAQAQSIIQPQAPGGQQK